RFKVLGLVNEPGFRAASKPDEFGLLLDEEVEPEPAGVDRTVYGKPSGVLGFRLFPNPEFNETARKKWNGDRFMKDPAYYNDDKLIRPYRVGVACGSCHIAPNPSNPPLDPENPHWENLASAIGNQYINEGKVFACNVEKGGFFYEMLLAQPRGTSDTSRIATDHINNPNAINAIRSEEHNSSHGYISYAVFCLKKKSRRLQARPLRSFPALEPSQRLL